MKNRFRLYRNWKDSIETIIQMEKWATTWIPLLKPNAGASKPVANSTGSAYSQIRHGTSISNKGKTELKYHKYDGLEKKTLLFDPESESADLKSQIFSLKSSFSLTKEVFKSFPVAWKLSSRFPFKKFLSSFPQFRLKLESKFCCSPDLWEIPSEANKETSTLPFRTSTSIPLGGTMAGFDSSYNENKRYSMIKLIKYLLLNTMLKIFISTHQLIVWCIRKSILEIPHMPNTIGIPFNRRRA